jgi:ribosomal protein L16 Arg81 hydroxylase
MFVAFQFHSRRQNAWSSNTASSFIRPGDTKAETIRKIQQAFSDDAMRVTQIQEWFNRFKDGRMSPESYQHSGRPSMN